MLQNSRGCSCLLHPKVCSSCALLIALPIFRYSCCSQLQCRPRFVNTCRLDTLGICLFVELCRRRSCRSCAASQTAQNNGGQVGGALPRVKDALLRLLSPEQAVYVFIAECTLDVCLCLACICRVNAVSSTRIPACRLNS